MFLSHTWCRMAEEPPPKRLRRGGLQQRIQKTEARDDAAPVANNLAHELLERWSWGEVSPQVVQKLAAASQRDFQAVGATPPSEIAALAGLGSGGLYPNNMHKEILQIANKNNAFSKPFAVKMSLKSP